MLSEDFVGTGLAPVRMRSPEDSSDRGKPCPYDLRAPVAELLSEMYSPTRKAVHMEQGQAEHLEYILDMMSVGIAILDAASLHICYVNPYLYELCNMPWQAEDVPEHHISDILPAALHEPVLCTLKHIAIAGQRIDYKEIPYEGFLEARGRTYWNITIALRQTLLQTTKTDVQHTSKKPVLVITVEDVTQAVRARLHINAIHYISSAIVGPSSLYLVLDRILQALHDMVGSRRCAVMLLDQVQSDPTPAHQKDTLRLQSSSEEPSMAIIAAQKGLHSVSHHWHPYTDKQILLGRVLKAHRTIIISDTETTPDITFPFLDNDGIPTRPGSVLCVPIFDLQPEVSTISMQEKEQPKLIENVLGTIEVYHRSARGFPQEEVQLLERFAEQAGLAIRNARLFRNTDRWAREASKHAQQIEAEVIARTAELKQRNQALQEAKAVQELTNARISLLLERLPTGVILVAAENAAITVINRRATEMLQQVGASLEPLDNPEEAWKQAIGRDCEQLLRTIPVYNSSGMRIPYEEHPLHKALIYGQMTEAELQMTRKDGQTIHVLTSTAPLCTPDGTVTSAILVLQEITRTKTLERAREDFFTTMAHELKTPLANIRAHLSALLTNDLQWSLEEQHDFLQTADEQVERLVDMINHFLDASRVEAGALRLELEPLLIPELVEDLQDRLEALINSSKRSLQLDVPPQLPAVRGDYELIISVLTNLLSNAFRYAPEGDAVQLTAQPIFDTQPRGTQTKRSPVGVRLSVIDRGPGISEEQQAVLFTRFSTFAAMSRPSMHRPGQPLLERRQKSDRWSPATGLGLYISRGIIEAHGSELTLTSTTGQGATFSFILPVFREKKRHL